TDASIVHLRACASVRVCAVYRVRCFYIRYSSNSCPECSIRWHVVDAVGQDIRPLEKTFHNACQESYWLKVNRQTHLPV
ncbi:TPA: hypothetical protein GM267_24465, partial [Escherichia coli]|nr:hypothetical protein [Escherichia coli]HAH1978537.1 hypothetical protein [Escherichia coli]